MGARIYYMTDAALSATANNVASAQILKRGKLKQLDITLSLNSTTDNSRIYLEVSKVPILQSTSGAQGPLTAIDAVVNFTTSGQSISSINKVVMMDVDVDVLETLYVNAFVNGTLSAELSIFAHVVE